jgi:two-component system, chemotaxis family, protein-glutamate methylesterase/glutaminase
MPGHDIIVVGASAGGVELALALATKLPDDLPAAVFIVIHISPSAESVLPALLRRRTGMRVGHAADGDRIEYGRIYVAPPDQHLIVRRGRVELTMGPRENGHRPAVDSLFRSAAHSYGPRVVGVVLSGNLDDGTAGAIEIHKGGGVVIAQDPVEALYPSMPRSAIAVAGADHIAPLDTIASILSDLSRTPVIEEEPTMSTRDPEPRPQRTDDRRPSSAAATNPQIGHGFGAADVMQHEHDTASGFTCPECHGALWETGDGQLVRYRCRVGHTFTQNVLLAEQARGLEAAMWTAYTALEEHAAFVQRMVARNEQQGNVVTVSRLAGRARDLHERATLIKNVLARGPFTVATEDGPNPTGAALGVAAGD